MVGLLIEIGSGKRKYDCVSDIIKKEDRCASGIKAPSQGLYLKSVKY